MLPNIPPEAVAEAAILAKGGYDYCQYVASLRDIHFLNQEPYIFIPHTGLQWHKWRYQ